MKILKEKDIVKYEGDEYEIERAWNHGGTNVFYDLREKSGSEKGYRRVWLSVYHTEVELVVETKTK